MTVSSAPGKVYLFGEHAAVYGEPAVPCAVERRATVAVSARDDDHVRVRAEDLSLNGFTVEYRGSTRDRPDVDVPAPSVETTVGRVDAAVDQACDAADTLDIGFDITVESDTPLGAGLGSSAAVVVAGTDAAIRELSLELEPRGLAERAYQAEHEIQDGQASRADTFCSAMGGVVRVEGDDCRTIDASSLPFVIGFDGGAGDIGALVSGVHALREEYDFAIGTVSIAGDIARRGEELLAEADPGADSPPEEPLSELGRFMDFNHGLLEALGVFSRSLDSIAWATREAGAYGTELTGAGGGGCIASLDPTPETQTTLWFTPGCEDAFRTELVTEGVRVEVPPNTDADAEGEVECERDNRSGVETEADSL